jgi:preprotein translocase subunit SecY
MLAASNSGGGGLAGLLALFTGGAFSRASVFALGIMPYISASIIMQLLGIAVPTIQKMQKEGESGQKKITQYTRILTIIITGFQAPGYLATMVTNVKGAVPGENTWWWVSSVMILIAGTMFVMWLGERITDKGIGNGISLLIMIGIIAGLPGAFIQELVGRLGPDGGGMVFLLVEMVLLVFVIGVTVALVQAVRKIPVQFAKRAVGNASQVGGARQYIPLKVNASGVMPIIFAQAIMFVPLYIAQYSGATGSFWNQLADFGGLWYNVLFGFMIIIFTYFYTAIMIDPKKMADDLKRNGGFIPGVKPGSQTAEYIDSLMSKITLPGSIFLAIVAILPAFAMQMDVKQGFAQFYGGTSLLIMVGVVLDTLQQIESHLLSRHYDGLMKSGKLSGRNSGSAINMNQAAM